MRRGRGVRRGHDRHDRSRHCPTASVDGEWRSARTSFRVRDESRPEGRSFGPQGQMPPIGLWAVGTNEPHARDKTVHGRRRRRMAADMDKFSAFGTKAVQRGVYSAHRGKCRSSGWKRLTRGRHGQVSAFGTKTVQRGACPVFRGRRACARHDACITCNTYSAAYKGKPSKKRLSPKWVNTLIHSYVTFYKTFIFQYLSLWKSVFSPN